MTAEKTVRDDGGEARAADARRDPGRRAASPAPPDASRILAIDALRGLVMALMALDHTRDFFFGFTPDPTDLDATTPALFATRWITHICAPAFLLLAGVSARLRLARVGRRRMAVYLLTRGAFLVALELTVVTFGWIPDPTRGLILIQVIWAIGWSMILLGLLLPLPPGVILAAGLAGAILHPAASDALLSAGAPAWVSLILLQGGGETIRVGAEVWIISYPILPWAAVMAIGFGLGDRLAGPPGRWAPGAAAAGLGLILLFAAARALTDWGDPAPWATTGDPVRAALAFLNVDKYPPSPLYLAVTLGLALLRLAGLGLGGGAAARLLTAFGRAPLFFYVAHLYALRLAGLAAAAAVWGVGQLGPPPLKSAPEWPLWSVWTIWAFAIAALWPPTRWFAALKARRGGWTSWF